MSFKFGYLGGSNIEESYNRLLSTSDLDSLDKEEEYLVLATSPNYSQGELCYLRYNRDFEVYADDLDEYQNIETWVFSPVDNHTDDFDVNSIYGNWFKFLLLDKELWGY